MSVLESTLSLIHVEYCSVHCIKSLILIQSPIATDSQTSSGTPQRLRRIDPKMIADTPRLNSRVLLSDDSDSEYEGQNNVCAIIIIVYVKCIMPSL